MGISEETTKTTGTTILKNSVFLYVRMLLLLVISLYTSREILKYLGVVDYGIYDVVAGLVTFVSFFNNSLVSATQRFLNYSLGKNNIADVFKTSFALHIGLAVVLVLLMETVGLWFLNNKVVMPQDRTLAANWAFQTSVVIGVLTILKTPYNAIIIAYERMNIFAYISILEAIFKLLIVYVLFLELIDALILYSILAMLVQFIITGLYFLYCKKQFPYQTAISFSIDNSILKEMLGFLGWSSYGGLSMLGYTQGLNVLLNVFFGPVQNAARGIAVQVEGIIRQFRGNFQVAVNPQLVKSYAENDFAYFSKLLSFGCKFSTYIMLAMIVPLCFRVDWILSLWLTKVPEHTSLFLKILLIASLIDSPSAPFVTGIQANGNIKYHEIINGTLLLMILPISYAALYLGGPAATVFIVYTIFMLLTLIVRICIFIRLLNISFSYIYNLIFRHILIVCCSSFFVGMVIHRLLPNTIFFSVIYEITVCLLVLAISYFWGLSVDEKYKAKSILKKVVNKFK